ncbi:MAG: hypothetical protein ACREEM_07195 [Blastocatellia bacterium]
MGMFDELRCEYPLPNAEMQDETFQTKSFDRAMDTYTITRDGRLILHQVRYELVPEEERPSWGKPEWDRTDLAKWAGSLKRVPVGDVEVPFHGDIRFYTSKANADGRIVGWFEYRARFTEGRLQWIKRMEDRR